MSNCVQKAEGIVGRHLMMNCHVFLRMNCFYIYYVHFLTSNKFEAFDAGCKRTEVPHLPI